MIHGHGHGLRHGLRHARKPAWLQDLGANHDAVTLIISKTLFIEFRQLRQCEPIGRPLYTFLETASPCVTASWCKQVFNSSEGAEMDTERLAAMVQQARGRITTQQALELLGCNRNDSRQHQTDFLT